ncbi:sulfatase family protein [Caulifigura coniformis]|nr:sulfatase [Caulifigura coniformis]
MPKRFHRVLSAVAMAVILISENLQAAPPNVVLIISDDHGWKDYEFMGHSQLKTPHLDRLASESLVFTRGHVPMSLCRPSLSTIITGRYPHQHGIVGNDPPIPPQARELSRRQVQFHPDYQKVRTEYIAHIDDEATLPAVLGSKLGYVSFQTGKWWEGPATRGGFTEGMTHGDMTRGGRHGDEGLKIGREGMQPAFEFMAKAVQDEKPFLLWYAPLLPHSPHKAPERLIDKYKSLTPHHEVARYWASVEWFDETVGELMSELDRLKVADNTLVLYLADNGWLNKPDADAYAPRSKLSPYEGGLRTPIMIRWPGKVAPRREEKQLASSIDLAPTALRACGLAVPETLPGIDLLDSQQVAARSAVFGEIFEHDIQSMDAPRDSLKFRWVIEGDWKLIKPYEKRLPDATVELFNLADDPDELKNLATHEPSKVAELTRKLDGWWAPDTQ